MDFKEELLQLSRRISKQKEQVLTEEATKTAFVLPFLQILGYDVFNPDEVEPEYTCDIGIKKGEKIDYAIKCNGEPIILVECKHLRQDLALHVNQLFRYYVVTKARFAILTNGIQYRFFSDVEKSNIMDTTPFFEVDITNINEYKIEQIKKFHKARFDEQYICETIPSIKYINSTLINLNIEKIYIENECAKLQHQLEHKQNELETYSKKVNELEDALRIQKETFIKKSRDSIMMHNVNPAEDNELDTLTDYLNMPVPHNWRKLSLLERKNYWGTRSMWNGKPREFICNSEVSLEFYNYERKDLNTQIGRRVSDAIERTGLFYRDGTKKRFGDYGSAIAWIRKKRLYIKGCL